MTSWTPHEVGRRGWKHTSRNVANPRKGTETRLSRLLVAGAKGFSLPRVIRELASVCLVINCQGGHRRQRAWRLGQTGSAGRWSVEPAAGTGCPCGPLSTRSACSLGVDIEAYGSDGFQFTQRRSTGIAESANTAFIPNQKRGG